MALIEKCICGEDVDTSGYSFASWRRFGLELKTCQKCAVTHQVLDMTEEEYANFYKEQYHTEFQEERGTKTYKDRYKHDTEVAALRADKYKDFFDIGMKILDIGASNGAFIEYLRGKFGYEAWGLDYTEHPLIIKPPATTERYESTFHMVTMHDVFEHLTNPAERLEFVFSVLRPNGTLIIDSPDFFSPHGKHHWKPIEHLWYYDVEQLKDIVSVAGFTPLYVDYPIPGKLVLYCKSIKC